MMSTTWRSLLEISWKTGCPLSSAAVTIPEAQYFLILFGTNDSGSTLDLPNGVPSGLGSDPPDPGTFKYNMQQIINAILAAGKEPILAKIPITLGSCSICDPFPGDPDAASRNERIKEYNIVIQELKHDPANSITVQPPDFYALFNEDVPGGKRYEFEYSDNLHPNGIGYQSMANLWFNALTN